MLPENTVSNELFKEISYETQTYKIDFAKKKVIGIADGKESLEQAIYLQLLTERYDHEIFSFDYGIEVKALYGKPKEYIYAMIQDKIEDALVSDDRINEVSDFIFETPKKDVITVSFVVHSGEGVFNMHSDINLKRGE